MGRKIVLLLIGLSETFRLFTIFASSDLYGLIKGQFQLNYNHMEPMTNKQLEMGGQFAEVNTV